MVQASCFNEKVNGKPKKVDIVNPKYEVIAPRGTIRAAGTCASCGGKVSGFVKTSEASAEARAKSEKVKAASRAGKGSKKGGSQKSKGSKGSKNSKGSKGSKKGKK